jgi:hypothetical protein
VTSLVQAFAVAAKLANTLHDEFRNIDGETQVARLTEAIVNTLDKTDAGRTPLAALLDHPDSGVRAWAGACLIFLLPRRSVPIAPISLPILPFFVGSTTQDQVARVRIEPSELGNNA